jgi:hypothetical protein
VFSLITYHLLLITIFLSSPHEMNNLYAVAFIDGGLLPVGAADDPVVQLDGEAFGRERELLDEFGQRDCVRHVARFAVDLDQQVFRFLSSFRLDE